jgi:hypothetical protein
MSDLPRPAEPTRKGQESTTRTVDAVSKVVAEPVVQAARIPQSVVEEVTSTMEAVSENVSEGQYLLIAGVRSAGAIAKIGLDRGQRLLASTVQVMDVYRDATTRSTDRLQAMLSSCFTFGRGMQQMQRVYLTALDQTIQIVARKPRDALRYDNIVAVAEIQRDLYLEAVRLGHDTSQQLLDITIRAATEAALPLQSNTH